MIMLATERSSDTRSSALVFETGGAPDSISAAGGPEEGGAFGSRTLCNALGSLGAIGMISLFLGGLLGLDGVVEEEIALSKSFSNEAIILSASVFAFSNLFISSTMDSCVFADSAFWFLSLTSSVSTLRSLATKTDSRSFPWSSLRPAISGSDSGMSGSSALYSKRFKIRNSRFMPSTRDFEGATSSCSVVCDKSAVSLKFSCSNWSILNWRLLL
mmetsp:Transcript_3722/g.7733  ORF Transcript_3722/g.7733 Transcript_3722/m.7733 type:complete len:215 (+) Transcript_3722:1124-1768(+)